MHYCGCKGTTKLQLLQRVFQRMLTKFHYADWDAKLTAVINTGVVLFLVTIAMIDILLIFISPFSLQYLYNYPKIRYLSTDAFFLLFSFYRYYVWRKDILHSMSNVFRNSRIDNGYVLSLITFVILVGAFAVLFCVVQFIKDQGIELG